MPRACYGGSHTASQSAQRFALKSGTWNRVSRATLKEASIFVQEEGICHRSGASNDNHFCHAMLDSVSLNRKLPNDLFKLTEINWPVLGEPLWCAPTFSLLLHSLFSAAKTQ